MNTAKDLIKYDIETAVITALEAKYKDIKITDGKSYAFVMKGIGEYRELRLKIDDKHKELKKDVLEYGRAVDAEKNRLKALLEPGENHLKEIRQAEDDRKAKIKAEKEAKDKERIDKIRSRISAIQAMSTNNIALMPLKSLRELSDKLYSMEISAVEYMEFKEEAQGVLDDAYDSVQLCIVTATQREKEEAQRKAEGERLEKIRKEQEAAQKKIDAANREIEERRKELDEKARKEKLRQEQEEFERQATIKAEIVAKEKIEQAEHERLEKEEAESRERLRQEALRPDKEKLITVASGLLDIEIPNVKSPEAQEIATETRGRLNEMAIWIKEQAEKL